MNKRISVGVAVSLVLIAIAITFSAATIFSMRLFDSKVSSAQERATMYDKLSEIDKIIRQNYYGDIDDAALFSGTANGFIAGLGDKYSAYLTAEQIAQRALEMEGTTVGFGIGVERNPAGYIVINKVVPDSSADKVMLKIGDIITKIDGQDVLAAGYDVAKEMLTGVEGSKASVVYSRDGVETTVDLTRTTTESSSVEYTQLNDIAYVRVDRINNTTATQFARAITDAAAADGSAGIVIDMRDTNGGYDIAIVADMLDVMLPRGVTVTGTFAGGEVKTLFTSAENSVPVPVAVLVNEKTTGFSELFTAVMSDADNVTIIGKPTAGQGTLQQLIKLGDGSGVCVTVALLAAPKSGPFNETGVKPDYEVSAGEKFILVTKPDEALDAQYQKAAETLRAKH